MNHLNIKYHHDGEISIKDTSSSLNLSECKWTSLIDFLFQLGNYVYFNGCRPNYVDADFEQTLSYASDKILIDNGKNHFRLLTKIKEANIILNRVLISKLWSYYEFPSLIFLNNEHQERTLSEICIKSHHIIDIINSINDVVVIYQSFEPNVLWIKSDVIIDRNLLTSVINK